MHQQDRLAAATDMGVVTLLVADVDAVTDFYVGGVGLDVLATTPDGVMLGRVGAPVLELRVDRELRSAATGAAGLFHTAILFDSRAALAAAVYGVATRFPRAFTGSSDHLVSQAFYFDDVEGNGVELYWDRPRDEWRWDGEQVRMATLPLDPNAFLREHLSDARTADGTRVGHVHLKVGDIPTARHFYVDVLGFDVTASFGDQALFVSAGGYHHHLGMNTWRSRGAGPRTPALGLGLVSLRLPHADAMGALRERLEAAAVPFADDGRTLSFDDPWANAVRASTDRADDAFPFDGR